MATLSQNEDSNPRRSLWRALGVLAVLMLAGCATTGTPTVAVTEREALGPDGYDWDPAAAPSGPVNVEVDLTNQMLYVYREGIEIGRAKISSGKPGHDTPTGTFTILEKKASHRSSSWGSYVRGGQVIGDGRVNHTPAGASFRGASMPYMMRLTWTGVAMHIGYVPDRPASHGCIRLPSGFAPRLFSVVRVGTPVRVYGHRRAEAVSTGSVI
ncbi:MAG: L,D-transpeptidase family protein [Verrucomicrobiota bacterium]